MTAKVDQLDNVTIFPRVFVVARLFISVLSLFDLTVSFNSVGVSAFHNIFSINSSNN